MSGKIDGGRFILTDTNVCLLLMTLQDNIGE